MLINIESGVRRRSRRTDQFPDYQSRLRQQHLPLAFVLSTPLILIVPAAATAPALVVVGIFMMQSVIEIPMNDFKTAAPAVLTIFAIPLTFSIAEGIGLGLISAAVLALGLGKPKSLTALGYVVAAVFLPAVFQDLAV